MQLSATNLKKVTALYNKISKMAEFMGSFEYNEACRVLEQGAELLEKLKLNDMAQELYKAYDAYVGKAKNREIEDMLLEACGPMSKLVYNY